MRKIFSLVLALILVLGLAAPAMAAPDDTIVTIYLLGNGYAETEDVAVKDLPDRIAELQDDWEDITIDLDNHTVYFVDDIVLSEEGFCLTVEDGIIDCQGTTRAFSLENDETELSLENVKIINGSEEDGGAIYINDQDCYVHGIYGQPESAVIELCHARNCGGAIRATVDSDNVDIDNITFIHNSAEDDGGAILLSGDNSEVTDCVFKENYAEEEGGAIYVWKGDYNKITGCDFASSNSAGTNEGQDIYCDTDDVTLKNNHFESNADNRVFGAFKNLTPTTGTFLGSGSLVETVFLGIIAVGVVAIYVSSKKKKSER